MKNKLLILLSLLTVCASAQTQNCTSDEELINYPGKFRPGRGGSISNVSATSLAKQKMNVANFVKRLQQNLNLQGFNIIYSGVYGHGYTELEKKRKADEYSVSMPLMQLYCENGQIKEPHETGYWINIDINKMPVKRAISFFVKSRTDEEDPDTDRLYDIDQKPFQKNGVWILKENYIGGFGKDMTRYKWIISYNTELPFRYVSQKEVIDRLIVYFQKKIRYTKVESEIEYFNKMLRQATEYLASHNTEELNQPAIVRGSITSIFYDYETTRKIFYSETDDYKGWVVDNNPQYFKSTLPPHTPQLIVVEFEVNEKNEAVLNNMYKVMAALGTDALKSMLGNPDPFKNIKPSNISTVTPINNQPTKPIVDKPTVTTNNNKPAVSTSQKENKPTETIASIESFDPSQPVYDLDKNKYTVLKIGNQYWLKENLSTTKYNDSTEISTGLNDNEWKQTKNGAYAIYENRTQYNNVYGKLYNGYAVATGKLCPKGWRIPSDKDWKELEQNVGIPVNELERTGERGNIADKLKTITGWKASTYVNNNSTGFSIMPAGSRMDNGEYSTLTQYGNFWTSTVYDDRYGLLYLWNHHTYFNTNAVARIYTLANNGYSCRCIKENISTNKK